MSANPSAAATFASTPGHVSIICTLLTHQVRTKVHSLNAESTRDVFNTRPSDARAA